MELRQLRYFVAVAEEMNFGRAAERLRVVQPTLSRQVGALEHELGFQLLERGTRPITFTAAGRLLFDEVKPSLQRIDRAVAAASLTATGLAGSLQIGYIIPAMWTVLLPILREYGSRFPEMRFDLLELPGEIQLQRLAAGLLDVGFVRPAHHDLLEFEVVHREPLVVALPAEHPLASLPEIDLRNLKEERFLLMNRREAPQLHDLHIGIFRQHGFTPDVLEVNNPSSLNLIALGQAVALVPQSFPKVGIDGIAYRPFTGPQTFIDLAIAYRRGDIPPAVEGFLDVVRQRQN